MPRESKLPQETDQKVYPPATPRPSATEMSVTSFFLSFPVIGAIGMVKGLTVREVGRFRLRLKVLRRTSRAMVYALYQRASTAPVIPTLASTGLPIFSSLFFRIR